MGDFEMAQHQYDNLAECEQCGAATHKRFCSDFCRAQWEEEESSRKEQEREARRVSKDAEPRKMGLKEWVQGQGCKLLALKYEDQHLFAKMEKDVDGWAAAIWTAVPDFVQPTGKELKTWLEI